MLKWLTRVLQIEPAPKKIMKLECKLVCESDPSLYGDAEYEAYEGDRWEFEVEVDHPKGAPMGPLDAYLDGKKLLTLVEEGRESEGTINSRRGDALPVRPAPGMAVEVKGPNGLSLTGVLAVHPRFA